MFSLVPIYIRKIYCIKSAGEQTNSGSVGEWMEFEISKTFEAFSTGVLSQMILDIWQNWNEWACYETNKLSVWRGICKYFLFDFQEVLMVRLPTIVNFIREALSNCVNSTINFAFLVEFAINLLCIQLRRVNIFRILC